MSGDVQGPGGPQRLDRAPGERYARRSDDPGVGSSPAASGRGGRGVMRALLAGDAVAAAGALVVFALGQVDVGLGLVAAAAAIGWAVALSLLWGGGGAGLPDRRTRMAVAGGLAAVSVLTGLVLDWAWSRAEGGVLDLLGYLDQRYGWLALVFVVVAAAAGALRARG